MPYVKDLKPGTIVRSGDCIRVANINGNMLDVSSKCSVAMVRPVFVIDKNHDIPHSCIKNPAQKG